jgi:DNA-binding transcriptional MerR regulator
VRSLGGHRQYPPHAVTTLKAIKAAQQLGFTLEEIAGLLAPARRGRGGLAQCASAKLAEIDRHIAQLTANRQVLAAAVEAGCDDLAACAAQPECPLPFPGHP